MTHQPTHSQPPLFDVVMGDAVPTFHRDAADQRDALADEQRRAHPLLTPRRLHRPTEGDHHMPRHIPTPTDALEAVYQLNAADPLGMVDERLHLAAAGFPPLADDDEEPTR